MLGLPILRSSWGVIDRRFNVIDPSGRFGEEHHWRYASIAQAVLALPFSGTVGTALTAASAVAGIVSGWKACGFRGAAASGGWSTFMHIIGESAASQQGAGTTIEVADLVAGEAFGQAAC